MHGAARTLSFAAAVALLASAWRADPFDPWVAFAAAVAVLAGMAAGRSTRRQPVEVGVDRAGRLALRSIGDGDGPENRVQCVFAASWLITLKRGTMWVSIWPDSVPGNTFRRLWVHIRWSSGRQPADLPAGTAAGQPK